ncbi:MAG: hypothetical protein QOI38_3135 [Sphingomonadales bacterium]|jgi:hypothetical protein|nr:hypothetical protein [Sphingomonadales bacterium]
MIRHRSAALVLALVLAGCGRDAPPLERALEGRAKAAIAAEFVNGRPVEFGRLWLADYGAADGVVCGRLDLPRPLQGGEDLRFVYEDRSRHGQIEWRDVLTGGPPAALLLEQNRRIFDELWARNCAPAEPRASWIAGILS